MPNTQVLVRIRDLFAQRRETDVRRRKRRVHTSMGRNDQWVHLTLKVDLFRQGLPLEKQEAFNEVLVRICGDPTGKRTGAIFCVRPPLAYYLYQDGSFRIQYLLYKRSLDDRERVDVIAAECIG